MHRKNDDDYLDVEQFITDYENTNEEQSLAVHKGAPKYTIEKTYDENSKLHGKLIYRNTHGNKIYECDYHHGNKDGEEITWYLSGKLKEKSAYKNNLLNGIKQCFNKYEVLTSEEYYETGALEGKRKTYDEIGKLLTESNYKNGLLHGKQLRSDPMGIFFVEEFNMGVRDGIQISYYSFVKNILSTKENFKLGIRHGRQSIFFDDGSIKSTTNIIDGELSGVQTSYYSNGNVFTIENFKESKRDGPQISYYQDGQLNTATNYHLGFKRGTQKGYFADGQLAFEEIYDKSGKLEQIVWKSKISNKDYPYEEKNFGSSWRKPYLNFRFE